MTIEPAPEVYRQALRDVIGHCIFGVDIIPMAVELCKINLWLESLEPGKPLSFLDHHIQCGNSLLGTTPALLKLGIPDDAFTPIEGDDKKLCTEYKKQNRDEHRGQKTFFTGGGKPWERMGDFAVSLANLETMEDDSLDAVRSKEDRYAQLVGSADYLSGRFWADAWCAAFVWKKTREFDYAITEDVFRRIERNPHDCTPWMRAEIQRLAHQYQFFQWHLAFPQVFRVPTDDGEPDNEQAGWSGGFHIVLGNPPWERIKIQEQEWFADKCPEIVNAPNATARRKLIEALRTDDRDIFDAWTSAKRTSEGESLLVRGAGAFPLCGCGDVNTFAVFAELNKTIAGSNGQVGCIVPTGIATDSTTSQFFHELMTNDRIVSIYDFSNDESLFPAVRGHQHFCLLTLRGTSSAKPSPAKFGFFMTNVAQLADQGRVFHLTYEDVQRINPNTHTLPVFPFEHDAEVAKSVYRSLPVFVRENAPNGNPWCASFMTLFHMANDSHLFRTAEQLVEQGYVLCDGRYVLRGDCYLPLFDPKMAQQYNHRAADLSISGHQFRKISKQGATAEDSQNPDYAPEPAYWVPKPEVDQRLDKWNRQWLLGFKDVTGVTSVSLSAFCVIPRVGVGHPFPVIFVEGDAKAHATLLTAFNSLVIEYLLRLKMQGLHVTYFLLKQLPVPHPQRFRESCPWSSAVLIQDWLLPRSLELTYTAWNLSPFACDCGYTGPPFRWDDERRAFIRYELDAAYFHIYGISRDNAVHILDSLDKVRRRDEQRFHEYRTKRVILEIYDAMAEAIRTGRPYQSVLNPPPGPPAAGLPDWKPGQPRPTNWPSHIHPPRPASGTAAAGPSLPQSPPSNPAAPAAWQMTRGQYQDHCKAQGRTDVTENNRTYWREVESAIQSGKPVPADVLAEYNQLKGSK